MSKKAQKRGIIILVCVLVCVGILGYLIILGTANGNNVLDRIDEYGYVLSERDTILIKETYNELKNELSQKEIDYENYAKLISILFIADLYTMDNKLNKYDVGGVDYIYPNHVDNYKLKVRDTLYRHMEESSIREDELPEVSKVTVNNNETSDYEYNKKVYDAFTIALSWEYKKDLGYDNKGIVTVIKVDNKLYVAEYTPEVSR